MRGIRRKERYKIGVDVCKNPKKDDYSTCGKNWGDSQINKIRKVQED